MLLTVRSDYHQRDAADALARLHGQLGADGLLVEGSSSSTGDLLVRSTLMCCIKHDIGQYCCFAQICGRLCVDMKMYCLAWTDPQVAALLRGQANRSDKTVLEIEAASGPAHTLLICQGKVIRLFSFYVIDRSRLSSLRISTVPRLRAQPQHRHGSPGICHVFGSAVGQQMTILAVCRIV